MLVVSTEQGSFSACARKLGKAQSAVSQGISNLEIDLGIQLFDRKTRKPTLTEDGERIYIYAKSVLELTGELDSVVKAIQNEEEPVLRLAFDSALFTPKLANILNEFSRSFSKTQIELLSVASADVAGFVTDGQADIGIMLSSLSPIRELEFCFIGNLEFCTVCYPEAELAHYDNVSVSQLLNHRQLLLRGVSGEGTLHLPQVSPDIWWCNSFDTIVKLVEQNLGWSCLPVHLVREEIASGKLAKFNVELDHKAWTLPVDVINHKGAKKGVAFQWLFEKLRNML